MANNLLKRYSMQIKIKMNGNYIPTKRAKMKWLIRQSINDEDVKQLRFSYSV